VRRACVLPASCTHARADRHSAELHRAHADAPAEHRHSASAAHHHEPRTPPAGTSPSTTSPATTPPAATSPAAAPLASPPLVASPLASSPSAEPSQAASLATAPPPAAPPPSAAPSSAVQPPAASLAAAPPVEPPYVEWHALLRLLTFHGLGQRNRHLEGRAQAYSQEVLGQERWPASLAMHGAMMALSSCYARHLFTLLSRDTQTRFRELVYTKVFIIERTVSEHLHNESVLRDAHIRLVFADLGPSPTLRCRHRRHASYRYVSKCKELDRTNASP
jgi:hypothetical protein